MVRTQQVMRGRKGGGGGSPPPPTRTPDNLRSKDTIELVLGVAEGPMVGLENGAKSFNIGDTALQSPSGDFNFKTFILRFFPGLDVADPVVPFLGGQSSNSAVNVTLATNTPVTRQTSIRNIDFIDVRLVWQRLLETNDSGTFNTTASFRIEYKKTADSTFTKAYNQDLVITGKTTSNYVKEFKIPVDNIDDDDYEIKITKLSAEDTETYVNTMVWESFQETIAANRAYDDTAILHLSGEATDQFSSIPQFSGVYKGFYVQIPSNYDPITREYTGLWDGSFQLAWTDNPAWCLYDFVMNDRYGIRSYYLDINLDKYDVYEAGQWCDELVPDGTEGGFQPRYTFNAYLTEARPGKELARYIAGSFNSTFFDDLNGKAYLRVDKDDPAAHIFTKENIYEEGFEYSYTDLTSRVNDITVTFVNPELDWVEDRRRVFNQSYINKHGRIPLDFIAVGCINAHEAVRKATYKLITANTETCLVKFKTNRLGSLVNPFDVMLIADPDMGYGITGRIKEVAENRLSLTLRTPIYLEVGVNYLINFTMSDGSKYKVSLQDVFPGYNTTLNFASELPETLPEKAVFAIEADGVVGLPRPFRVTKVEEEDGNVDAFIIEGICINRNKWYDADNLTDSGQIQYSALPSPFNPPGPTSCSFEERFIRQLRQFQITVSPVFNRGAYKYYANDHSFEVWSRLKDSNDIYVKREILFGDTLVNHPPGLYEFKVLGKSYLGFTSDLDASPTYTFNVTNPLTPPADIDWFRVNTREYYWGYEDPPADFDGFVLRYHNRENRTTWDDAIQPHAGVLSHTSFYTQLVPPSARVVMVRAVDLFGVVSENSAIIYKPLGALDIRNEVDRTDYHTPVGSPLEGFPGTHTNCDVDIDGKLKATDTGDSFYSETPTAFMYEGGSPSPDFYKATYSEMVYEAALTVAHAGETSIFIEFEGSGYEVNIRDVGETIWRPLPERQYLDVGNYEIQLRIFGGSIRGIVEFFSVIVDAEDIIDDIQDVTISSGGTRLVLTKEFTTIKNVSIIIQDEAGASTAVGYRVVDKDPDLGPLIKLVDASGAYVGGLVDAIVKGFN